MKVNEIIECVGKNTFYSLFAAEETIQREFGPLKKAADGLDFDEHRWYSITTTVYECEDGYVGVTGCSQLKSEMMSWEDTNEIVTAAEYEAVPTVTYKRK